MTAVRLSRSVIHVNLLIDYTARRMNHIDQGLFVGNFLDARDPQLLRENRIRSILCLDGELIPGSAESLGIDSVDTVSLVDRAGNRPADFLEAIDILEANLANRPNALVHCRAGRSRSVVVVAGYLMRARNLTAAQALAIVAARRDIHLSPGIEELLLLPGTSSVR